MIEGKQYPNFPNYAITKEGKIYSLNNHYEKEWCTYGHNLKQAYDTKLRQTRRGEKMHTSKLNEAQVFKEPIGKSIPGYSNYIITKEGEVYSKFKKEYKKPIKINDSLYVRFYYKGQGKQFPISYLVAYLYLDSPKKDMKIIHKDGDKTNNHYQNLNWHPLKKSIKKGKKGSRNGKSKLNEKKVYQILDLKRKGWTQQKIADYFKVGRSTIGHIFSGSTWNHIKLELQKLKEKNKSTKIPLGKKIPNYPNYILTKEGEVYSMFNNRFLKHKYDGGYAKVSLNHNNKTKKFRVHRLVATLYLTREPGKNIVVHKDGNIYNNSYDNLEWQSWKQVNERIHSQNERGRKITPEKLKKILEMKKKGLTTKKIADTMGVTRQTVRNYLKRYEDELN